LLPGSLLLGQTLLLRCHVHCGTSFSFCQRGLRAVRAKKPVAAFASHVGLADRGDLHR
jgi:hypothetical protein